MEVTLDIDSLMVNLINYEQDASINWSNLGIRILLSDYEEPLRGPLDAIADSLRGDIICQDLDNSIHQVIDALHHSAKLLSRKKFKKHLKLFWNSDLSKHKAEKVLSYRI